MLKGKKAIIAGLIVVLLAAIAAKLIFFPSIKDAYFALGFRDLQQVPSGLVVLRPTHYPFLRYASPMIFPRSRTNVWIVGRNAPLQDLIAVAYGERPSRVVLPPDAPKGNFDFLVTVDQARERLQAAIQHKLGCRAQKEWREAEVLALKVVNPALPGMTLNNGRRGSRFDGGRIYLNNAPVGVVGQILNQLFDITVVDKTGLTSNYDYSVQFQTTARSQLQDVNAIRASADKLIERLGLGLETDTEPGEVLVVKTKPMTAPVLPDKNQLLLGPLNPGAEEGSEHWYHGIDGQGVLLTDNTDPASGENDFTVENTITNQHNHAEWRCEMFSLGSATNGARPVSFSFDYKLPGPVNDGDNLRVQLRFFDQNTNFIDQKVFFVGTSSHDSAMTSYKTLASGDVVPPAAARVCDVTLSANLYDDHWSSGIGRFDNIFVTTEAAPHR